MTESTAPRRHVALKDLTTFGIGGVADSVLDVSSPDQIVAACARLRAEGTPLTFLGGGSNVLIGDLGVRGAVLRLHGGEITRSAAGTFRVEAGVSVNGVDRRKSLRADVSTVP